MLLDKINEVNDIKKLNKEEFGELAQEIRDFLVEKISVSGGHLASNLGVVELTMALHLSFNLPEDKIVYFMMHEDKNDFGDVKPKTIGKMLDEKVCLEGLFTIVLRCITDGDRHLFITQSTDGAVSKSPMGMFSELEIDNDLYMVDQAIREYYGFDKTEEAIK